MATTAASLITRQDCPQAAAYVPDTRMRAIDWPCCAAPSMVHAWQALARLSGEPNPFFEDWYLLPALATLDPGETVRMVLLEADGDLAGVMPVSREKRYYGKPIAHLSGWTHPNAFLGAPLVAPGFERRFWQALFAWADRQEGKGLFLHLPDLPLDGRLWKALQGVLDEDKRPWGLVYREERAMLCSDTSPEDYFLASLSGKKRKELRRQLARLSELGRVEFVHTEGTEGIDRWIEHFLDLESAGWKGLSGSALAQREQTARLFRDSLKSAAARGRLERRSLTLDGRPIAMLSTFLTQPGAYSFKTAYDEDYSRYSPGVLLQCENLTVLDRQDIAWTDSCAASGHPMIDHIWRERRAVGRVSVGIGGSLRRRLFSRLLKAELARNPTGIEP